MFLENLIKERDALKERLESAVIAFDVYDFSPKRQAVIVKQMKAMTEYLHCLRERIAEIENYKGDLT